MSKRYLRAQAPKFNAPRTPVNPITTERETLAHKGNNPYCAMMQVAVEDTHDDYLICRGWDTRVKRYFDYVEGDADQQGIAVAKPYGVRGTYLYEIGEVHAAFLPLMRLSDSTRESQNPGKAETTVGHPADLDEDVVVLQSDEGIYINWMIVNESATRLVEMCLAENHPGRNTVFEVYMGVWSEANDTWEYPDEVTTYKAIDRRYDVPYPDAGSKGLFTPRKSDTHGVIYENVSLDCSTPGTCSQ